MCDAGDDIEGVNLESNLFCISKMILDIVKFYSLVNVLICKVMNIYRVPEG